MRTAKYCLIRQMDSYEYSNQHNNLGVITGYNIYTYSFQDVCSYITQDLLDYYLQHCREIDRKYDRKFELSNYAKYILISGDYTKPKNLRAFEYIYSGYRDYYMDINNDVSGVNFLTDKNFLLTNFVPKVIEKIINNERVEYFYSFPISKVEIKVKAMWNKEHPVSHHSKSMHYALPRRRELALSHDPEVREYLDARDMFKGNFWRHKGIRHNRHSYVPGDWKHYHKCRKQWAKNKENPSYEKLSRAVWKQEQKEMEELVNGN